MNRKPTMNDVARVAGVGRGTVSNYINGRKIKEENRQKVDKAIKELGYIPNLQARELKTSTNSEIVFIVPTNWTSFFSEMIFYMQEELSRHHYKMILENSHSSPQEEKEILRMAALNQVAGVITMSYSDFYNFTDFSENLNLVSIERQVSPEVPLISSDNKGGGILAAKQLLKMHRKHLLLLSRETHHHTGTDLRAEAFSQYLANKGIKFKRFRASLEPSYRQEIYDYLKKEGESLDGIFAVTDEYGMIAKRALAQIDPKLLQQIEIIGFDGARNSQSSPLFLDTIQQPIKKLVKEAVHILLKKIDGETVENNYRKILPVTFVKAERDLF